MPVQGNGEGKNGVFSFAGFVLSWGFVLPARKGGKFVPDSSRAMIQVLGAQRIISRAEAQRRGGRGGANCAVLCGFVPSCEALSVPARGVARGRPAQISVTPHLTAWTLRLEIRDPCPVALN